MVSKPKCGLTLIEVAISILVLGVVSTTVAEVIQWSAAQHRAAERKRCALDIANAILDRFTIRDWSTITPGNAAKIKLPAEAAHTLGDAHLLVQVEDEKAAGKTGKEEKALESKCVTVEISWTNGASSQVDRVQLSTWVFARTAESAVKGRGKQS
jgi:prepilin-type N-terminal cleavage/methylation domain-containing protein